MFEAAIVLSQHLTAAALPHAFHGGFLAQALFVVVPAIYIAPLTNVAVPFPSGCARDTEVSYSVPLVDRSGLNMLPLLGILLHRRRQL